jgi:hypothetical protein
MTAATRAVWQKSAQKSGPKVLRIGLVQGGRLLQERIIRQRTSVTIGPSEGSMFVVPVDSVPAEHTLFERIGSDYYLNLLDTMTGRVALKTGIRDIEALRGTAKRIGKAYPTKLTEQDRGKVVAGDVTFLFQFVEPPPARARPKLPLAVKGGLASQLDWSLTIIAALSFLLHFGLVGGLYSDWMDPVVDDDMTVGPLIDMIPHLPAVTVEDSPTAVPAGPATAFKTAGAVPSSGQPKPPAGGGASPGAVSNAHAAALAREAQALEMQILTASGGGSAVQGALNRADIPPVGLEGAAESTAGTQASTGNDLHFGAGGEAKRPGAGRPGLANIGNTVAVGVATAGADSNVHGPVTGMASVGPVNTTAPVANAERVVASLRPGFRTCYNKGLQSDPSMAGKVLVSARISPNGEVASAGSSENTGLSSDVVECILRKVRTATFDTPGSNGSTIQIPVTFVQQGR